MTELNDAKCLDDSVQLDVTQFITPAGMTLNALMELNNFKKCSTDHVK